MIEIKSLTFSPAAAAAAAAVGGKNGLAVAIVVMRASAKTTLMCELHTQRDAKNKTGMRATSPPPVKPLLIQSCINDEGWVMLCVTHSLRQLADLALFDPDG